MNNSSHEVARCVPMQLSGATAEGGATAAATNNPKNSRKPASIQELRAQLRAQQGRNDQPAEAEPVAQPVATEITPELEPWQLELAQEFQAFDRMPADDARSLAAVSVRPRPTTEWMTLIARLDQTIERYCATRRVPPATCKTVLAARFGQSLASIPETLAWFEREMAASG